MFDGKIDSKIQLRETIKYLELENKTNEQEYNNLRRKNDSCEGYRAYTALVILIPVIIGSIFLAIKYFIFSTIHNVPIETIWAFAISLIIFIYCSYKKNFYDIKIEILRDNIMKNHKQITIFKQMLEELE